MILNLFLIVFFNLKGSIDYKSSGSKPIRDKHLLSVEEKGSTNEKMRYKWFMVVEIWRKALSSLLSVSCGLISNLVSPTPNREKQQPLGCSQLPSPISISRPVDTSL